MSTKNPKWVRDELILLLNLYFEIDFAHKQDEDFPKIKELSKLLNLLPIHDVNLRGKDFRNPTGVNMKLRNFLRLDSTYPGKGLEAGSKLDAEVWNEFASDPDRLRDTAMAIARGYQVLPQSHSYSDDQDDEEFPEGKILTRLHKLRERNSTLTKRKKKKVLKENGNLECQVCSFDFNKAYGQLGYGFAECHHTIPLSSMKSVRKTKLSELAIVCANCHRMLHNSHEWLSIEELKTIINSNRSQPDDTQ